MASLHERAKDVFLEALARPSGDREAFVAEACGDDPALRQEVESLLAFHEGTDDGAPPDPAPTPRTFAPGEVIAGRYRMINRIGRGGMGDVWRADDLVLRTPVALKLIRSTGPDARDRILNEVRLARQITHPAVCRVFDVGEAEGGLAFYSMELIRGEDLATLVRRVGRLPSDTVTDIARQLCAGLAAAHAQGVLHRDLKPANVLIDNDGVVRITDFGIAIPRSDASLHLHTGTPRYMAPEQQVQGAALSERTDVYALGLLLYELLAGRLPPELPGPTQQMPRLSTLVPNVNAQLERVVMQALSPDPQQRPASAVAMAAALPDIGTRRDTTLPMAPPPTHRRAVPWWAAGLALAAVVAVLAALSSFLLRQRASALTGQDTIVLADFENTTGEPVFDGALKVALAVALEQSPFLKVFPDERARDTLQLMQRPPDTRITRAVAREIAQREDLKALLAGSIAKFGNTYVMTIEAIHAESGDVMAREQSQAPAKEQVLSALGEATSRLRQKLGESLASVENYDVSLPRATTASLEALNAYALALSEGREVPRLEAIPHLKRALDYDKDFAMAHALLSSVYVNTGQSTLAPAYARRAFELRDRVSQRERFFISWRYYRDAAQDWGRALELARAWTTAYPREAFAQNSLGSALIRLGGYKESITAFREAIRLDSRFTPAYSNLAAALLAVDDYAGARATLRDAADKKLEFIGARRLSYLLAFVEGDAATMQRELEASIGVSETNAAYGWQAHASAFAGKVNQAHDQFRQGIQMSLQGEFKEVAAQLTMEDAETHAIVGQCPEALSEVKGGMALSEDNSTLERASRVLALCGEYDAATSLSATIAKRFPEATLTIGMTLPVTSAAIALRRGDAAGAVTRLQPVAKYDHAPSGEFWPLYLRGLAYLQSNDPRSAAAQFQAIVDHRGEVPAMMLYPLAYLGLGRASAAAGETEKALAAYDRFFMLWSGADADLEPLKKAKTERELLSKRSTN